ncbi:CPBP family intramembrane glutamic endopeptidase [Rubrivirga sp. IMCC45206]|uniref:CPBP family intramembrane glutamic endopeptidase n=1 Tax=Rubrivirga sp. IMCC45206 TaxID=3391614 RepID=UPI00398FEF40
MRGSRLTRVALFWIASLALSVAVGLSTGLAPPALQQAAWGLGSSVLLFALTRAFLRWDRRALADVGLALSASSAGRFGIGVALAVGLYGLTLGTLHIVAGPLAFRATPPVGLAAVGLAGVTYLLVGVMEELAFRGYALRTLVPALGEGPAQAVVAVVFAATHLLYGWTWESILFGVLPSGLLFGAVAIASRGLAMPLGLHVAANWFQWTIGEKGTPGLWGLDVPDDVLARVAQWAPGVSVALTLALTVLVWLWHRRARRPAAA